MILDLLTLNFSTFRLSNFCLLSFVFIMLTVPDHIHARPRDDRTILCELSDIRP